MIYQQTIYYDFFSSNVITKKYENYTIRMSKTKLDMRKNKNKNNVDT